MRIQFIIFIFFISRFTAQAQCEIKNSIWPDQTMYYSMASELFFYTEVKSLKGNITTDKQNYFLRLLPKPFPAKGEKVKLDHPLKIRLSNDSAVVLENFDSHYRTKDTSLSVVYIIPKEILPLFQENDIESLVIDLGDESGPRNYVFVLHRATLREQLKCLMEMK